ncbi:MAG: hypothetical protein JXR88_01775 [Clostridia bacterium]|nr:hypothetical protein [Clostridia bacterium]
MNYKQLINEGIQLYLDEAFEEAYDLLTTYRDLVKGNLAQIDNFRYSCLGKMNKNEEGYLLLEKAIKDDGFWYHPDLLLEDQDLEGFRNFKGFNELVDICKVRYEDAKYQSTLKHTYVESDLEVSKGLLVALHGNQENMAIAEDDWKSIFDLGYNGLFLQSDQVEFYDAFTWEDYEDAALKLPKVIQEFHKNEKMILAGFSGGGQVALWSVLTNQMACDHLLLVAPWLPHIEDWDDLLPQLKVNHTKVTILIGDADEDCYEGCEYLHKALEKQGCDVELLIFEDLNHEFPEDFDEHLKEILA